MEKKEIIEINVNYSDSGVNTLYGFGVFFFVLGIIFVIIAIIGLVKYLEFSGSSFWKDDAEFGLSMMTVFSLCSIGSFLGGAVCRGLSSIARTSLYQRMVLEREYYFMNK